MTQKQVTVTLDILYIQSIQKLADDMFEGNFSMALRHFLRKHNVTEIIGHIT